MTLSRRPRDWGLRADTTVGPLLSYTRRIMGVSLGELPYCVEGQSIVLGKYGGIFLDFSCFYFNYYIGYMQCFQWGPKRGRTLSSWSRILEYCYRRPSDQKSWTLWTFLRTYKRGHLGANRDPDQMYVGFSWAQIINNVHLLRFTDSYCCEVLR